MPWNSIQYHCSSKTVYYNAITSNTVQPCGWNKANPVVSVCAAWVPAPNKEELLTRVNAAKNILQDTLGLNQQKLSGNLLWIRFILYLCRFRYKNENLPLLNNPLSLIESAQIDSLKRANGDFENPEAGSAALFQLGQNHLQIWCQIFPLGSTWI